MSVTSSIRVIRVGSNYPENPGGKWESRRQPRKDHQDRQEDKAAPERNLKTVKTTHGSRSADETLWAAPSPDCTTPERWAESKEAARAHMALKRYLKMSGKAQNESP